MSPDIRNYKHNNHYGKERYGIWYPDKFVPSLTISYLILMKIFANFNFQIKVVFHYCTIYYANQRSCVNLICPLLRL